MTDVSSGAETRYVDQFEVERGDEESCRYFGTILAELRLHVDAAPQLLHTSNIVNSRLFVREDINDLQRRGTNPLDMTRGILDTGEGASATFAPVPKETRISGRSFSGQIRRDSQPAMFTGLLCASPPSCNIPADVI
ncbi:MAG: hypothetical protein Q9200_007092 [Gallowayella weberi]